MLTLLLPSQLPLIVLRQYGASSRPGLQKDWLESRTLPQIALLAALLLLADDISYLQPDLNRYSLHLTMRLSVV